MRKSTPNEPGALQSSARLRMSILYLALNCRRCAFGSTSTSGTISVCVWVILRPLCSALYTNFQGGNCLTHVGRICSVLEYFRAVKSGEAVTEKLDDETYATGVVSTASWTQSADGSWSSSTSATAASVTTACEADNGVMTIGTHHVEIVDAEGVLLAENWYTVEP